MLILDASTLLGVLADIDRPDLIRMLARAHKLLVVTSHVDAEVIDRRSREALDMLIEAGTVAALRINTNREILEFLSAHEGTGRGEADVILACEKIVADGGSATGVLDERMGRAVAKRAGIKFTGLIGLLAALEGRGILSEREHGGIIRALRHSKFRLPKRL